MEGWIKLHRKIMDHWIWQDPEKLRAWLDLVMLVNHEVKKICIDSQVIEVKPGQHWTSEMKLAERWQWNRKRVARFLNLLQSDDMILKESTKKGTMLTIVNYGVYQGFSEKSGQQSGQQSGQRKGHQRDNGRDTNNNDIRMIKNEKENKGGRFQ